MASNITCDVCGAPAPKAGTPLATWHGTLKQFAASYHLEVVARHADVCVPCAWERLRFILERPPFVVREREKTKP